MCLPFKGAAFIGLETLLGGEWVSYTENVEAALLLIGEFRPTLHSFHLSVS